jgi:N,N'-diacetyllegionaminate synthase
MEKKTLIIAEAGVNHNGSLELAKQLVEVAARAGADYVKFQTFKADLLVSREARKADYQQQTTGAEESQWQMLRRLELSEEDHQQLLQHCQQHNIRFLSTAFDADSIQFLGSLGMDLFKVPSGELTNWPYLRHIARQQKPVILSTGMATLGEIERAIRVLEEEGIARQNISVLHCTTEYPTPPEHVNLRAMHTIGQAFGVRVGYSDHTRGIEVPLAAVALGATIIEKHITLDRGLPGPDHLASLEPEELQAMVAGIRNIELALGSPLKQPTLAEEKIKMVGRKSLHLSQDLKAGTPLTEAHLLMKRPGDGLSADFIPLLLGRRLRQDLPADTKLRLEDVG